MEEESVSYGKPVVASELRPVLGPHCGQVPDPQAMEVIPRVVIITLYPREASISQKVPNALFSRSLDILTPKVKDIPILMAQSISDSCYPKLCAQPRQEDGGNLASSQRSNSCNVCSRRWAVKRIAT